jgi:hypothetical protein
VKKTCAQRETLYIGGFAMKENKFDGLYVGRQKGGDLIYAGKVDNGFDSSTAKDLQAGLNRSSGKLSPTPKRLRTAGSGPTRRRWPKSSTGPNRPKGSCAIRSSRVFGSICDGHLRWPGVFGFFDRGFGFHHGLEIFDIHRGRISLPGRWR